MKKVIIVKTDDPEKRKFNLVVTGPVGKVVVINPVWSTLDGTPGDTLESIVTITPSEKYQFSILGMEQKFNTKIKAKLIEPKSNEKSWQIKIKTTSDKADNYYDVLTVKTDSPYRPTLTIRVYANFFKKSELKPELKSESKPESKS